MAELQGGGPARENWASRLGFVLAAAGSAVGLGNIWRFPYMTGTSGGAAFVALYLVLILAIGYPLMVTEMAIGRKTQRNAIGAFKALAPNSPWWIAGAMGVLAGFIILSYYSVIAGWAVAYVFKALSGSLGAGADFGGVFVGHITNLWGSLFWHAIFMFITMAVISAGVVKGIQRCVEFLMPMLAVLMLMIVVRSVTLPGAGAGLAFYLSPDFSEITPRVVLAAVGQAFFTLSLGMGCMITYGSYLRREDEIPTSALQVVGLDTGIALVAGFAIFPAVFAMGMDPAVGPGLTFITLPAVFAEMPLGGLFGVLFFVLLSIAALTSAISLLEVVVAWLIDEKGWSRAKATWIIGSIIFLVGVPSILGYNVLGHWTMPGVGTDVLDTFDWFANDNLLPLGGMLTAIFAGHVWTTKKAQEEANHASTGFRIGDWYGPVIKYLVPLAIFVVWAAGIYNTFWG